MSALGSKARFLSPNQISELVWDRESEAAGAPSDSFSEDEGGFEVSQGCHACNWTSKHPEGKCPAVRYQVPLMNWWFFQSGPGQQVQTSSPSQWTRPSGPQRSVVHTFTGDPRGKRDSEALHINEDSSPVSVFCWILQKLLHCCWWRLTDTTTTTLTDLTRDLHPYLT